MGVVLVLTVSILYPVLLFKILRFIHKKSQLRLYWILVPLCLLISISVPFLYSYSKDPAILLSLKTMMDYSVKSGFIIFLVIPSLTTSLLCTVYGYMNINKWSISIMSVVFILGFVVFLFSNSLVSQLIYSPEIRWEQISDRDIAGAGMWIYGDAAKGERYYTDLNEQETDRVHSMLNSVPKNQASEVPKEDHDLIASIGISLKSDNNKFIQIQYDNRNIYVEITKKRNQKEYRIDSPELEAFFDHKLKE